MRWATAQALRTRDSRVVLATRGVTCSVVDPCSGRPGSSVPGSMLSNQAAAMRPLASAWASALVEQARRRQAHQHLVGLAFGQVTLTQQAVVARVVAQQHAHAVAVLHQLGAAAPARHPSGPTGRHRRAPRGRSPDLARRRCPAAGQRPCGRRHADDADHRAAQLAPHGQALGIDDGHAAQHLQQRADGEFGLGVGAGGGRAHHLDTGARAGSRSRFSAPADSRPTVSSCGAARSTARSTATEGGNTMPRTRASAARNSCGSCARCGA
jgi:hypothetical protein